MLNAIEPGANGSELFADDDDDVWEEETTAVIPAKELEALRDVMDGDERPTAQFAPVRDPKLAVGTGELAQLPASAVCEEVSSPPRAIERSVTVAPAADKHRAWLVAVGLVLLAVEILALAL
jgi:hypothetical protein